MQFRNRKCLKKTALIVVSLLLGLGTTLPASSQPEERGRFVVDLKQVSDDPTYGYTIDNPIKVGGYGSVGARNEYLYLKMLTGPKGQKLVFKRDRACCPFKTSNPDVGNFSGGEQAIGLLDIFEVTYPGLDKPVKLFLNGYEYERPQAPKGFRFKQPGI